MNFQADYNKCKKIVETGEKNIQKYQEKIKEEQQKIKEAKKRLSIYQELDGG